MPLPFAQLFIGFGISLPEARDLKNCIATRQAASLIPLCWQDCQGKSSSSTSILWEL
jgi:hypothetical protein